MPAGLQAPQHIRQAPHGGIGAGIDQAQAAVVRLDARGHVTVATQHW